MWTGHLLNNFISLSLCKAIPYISCHFILTAALQGHVVVPIFPIRGVKLKEVKGFTQGHHGGDGNFGVQSQNV